MIICNTRLPNILQVTFKVENEILIARLTFEVLTPTCPRNFGGRLLRHPYLAYP